MHWERAWIHCTIFVGVKGEGLVTVSCAMSSSYLIGSPYKKEKIDRQPKKKRRGRGVRSSPKKGDKIMKTEV